MTKKIIYISDIPMFKCDTPKKRYKLQNRLKRIWKNITMRIVGDKYYD